MKKDIQIVEDNQKVRPKLSEVNRLFGSNKKLIEKTCWEPSFSGIEGFKKGLKETIQWFTKKENLLLYDSNQSFF